MIGRDPSCVQIDRVHASAICTETGERLRAAMARKPTLSSPDLLGLIEHLDGVERIQGVEIGAGLR
jgi:hypothetical protein